MVFVLPLIIVSTNATQTLSFLLNIKSLIRPIFQSYRLYLSSTVSIMLPILCLFLRSYFNFNLLNSLRSVKYSCFFLFLYSDWIQENTDQKNSVFEYFSLSVYVSRLLSMKLSTSFNTVSIAREFPNTSRSDRLTDRIKDSTNPLYHDTLWLLNFNVISVIQFIQNFVHLLCEINYRYLM